jgi:hypothetical protein
MDGWTDRPTYRKTDIQPVKMTGLTVFMFFTDEYKTKGATDA